VRYGTDYDAVPVAFGHRNDWIPGDVDAVMIGSGGKIIARHPHCCHREDMVFDSFHQIALIGKTINGLECAMAAPSV